jgi:putative membrane protein
VPAATEPGSAPPGPPPAHRRPSVLFRAPPPLVTAGLIAVATLALAVVLWPPPGSAWFEGWLVAFLAPALVAAGLTTPLARALGGRFEFHRGIFLALSPLLLELPLAAAWRGAFDLWPAVVPGVVLIGPFLVGPVFWFRELTLYGVSRPSHARTLPAALVQPVLQLAGFYVLVHPTTASLASVVVDFAVAFVCAVVVLHAADRPIRREFHGSGVSMIRPLLDHVGHRDEEATRKLESFFLKAPVLADLRVDLLSFERAGRPPATVVLPTVHPGPFAALGASDLPSKLEKFLGPDAGTVFVPHTPCDHDLDLPSRAEVERVGTAARELLGTLPPARTGPFSPLVSPAPGSTARAQILGDVALVVVSQAPAPTDDIAYAVADRLVRELARDGGPRPLLVDAHNSYIEGKGDISYGSPAAERLTADARSAIAAARLVARDGPLEVGVAHRGSYSIGQDGIGPHGLRALVVRTGATTTGYVLIDGNNLLAGLRARIVQELERVVDVAEVFTTDNHVVHEVDGGINPVGERYPAEALARDARQLLEAAKADLAPAKVRFGSRDVPAVSVLGPGYTARLLTSLGDTLAMFTSMFPAALILLLSSSLVVALVLR